LYGAIVVKPDLQIIPSPCSTAFVDQGSLTHFGESAVRAYNIAMTPPAAPVLLVQDGPIPPHQKLSW
jgi:hypothetical protein